jgi:hypothetical protein
MSYCHIGDGELRGEAVTFGTSELRGRYLNKRIRQVFYPHIKIQLLAQERRVYLNAPKLDSTAAKFSTMQLFSKKIPGYALASTFVALGGILNGYVSQPTVIFLTTCRLRFEN